MHFDSIFQSISRNCSRNKNKSASGSGGSMLKASLPQGFKFRIQWKWPQKCHKPPRDQSWGILDPQLIIASVADLSDR